jgi:hypothetical protein
MDQPLHIDRTVNINTIIAITSFVIMLVGGIVAFTMFQSAQQAQTEQLRIALKNQADAWVAFQTRQEKYNDNLDADRIASRARNDTRLDAMNATMNKLAGISDQQAYQVAQLQKKDDEVDARLGRMADSYGSQFAEIRAGIAGITTQMAVMNQTVGEIRHMSPPNSRSVQ